MSALWKYFYSQRAWWLAAVLLTILAAGTGTWIYCDSIATTVAVVLAASAAFRFFSLVRADIWLWKYGVDYRERVNGKPEGWNPTNQELLQIYEEPDIRGAFFPFGIRAIVLQVEYQKTRGLFGIILQVLYRGWKYYFFAPILSLVTYILLITTPEANQTARYWLLATGYVLGLGALAIAVEAALSYFTFGSWSLAYHRFDVAEQRGTAEIAALAGGVITALTSNASTMAVAAIAFDSYEDLQNKSALDRIALGYYYTLTAFTGNGDPGPENWAGYWQLALLYVQAAAYLLVVISLLLDSLGSEPGIHLPWVRRGGRASRLATSTGRTSDAPSAVSDEPYV